MAEFLPHIFLNNVAEPHLFKSKSKPVGQRPIKQRDRIQHGNYLKQKFEQLWSETNTDTSVSVIDKEGLYIEFEGALGFDLAFESLDIRNSGIRLLSIRTETINDEEKTYATVFIPKYKQHILLNKIKAYLTEEDKRSGKPKNTKLVESIENMKLAVVRSFWTDTSEVFPRNDESIYCEVWLFGNENSVETRFINCIETIGITKTNDKSVFPEKIVFVIKATLTQLEKLIMNSPDIAELRKAKEPVSFFTELSNYEQIEWIKDLKTRSEIVNSRIAICLLDTGINNGHMLLEKIIDDNSCLSVEADWTVSDKNGHGTEMAGICAYGDLQDKLESKNKFKISHILESVKILPDQGENDNKLYGALTARAISLVEIQNPTFDRIICMPVTTTDFRDQGQPSAWSAELDKIIKGESLGNSQIFIVSAGNIRERDEWKIYPESNLTNQIHDPGQSWNAITVGACTNKTTIYDSTFDGWKAIASNGSLSPFSTTSLIWDKKWPNKPDIVMEGGNAAISADKELADTPDDLSCLTISKNPVNKHFSTINATSAAAAFVSELAAQIKVQYPDIWPETLRALIIHSATWTNAMKEQFLSGERKLDYGNLLKVVGYGVPNAQKAIHCLKNSLTLISQETLQPYYKDGDSYKTKDMHFYELPWPKEELLSLGEKKVELKITLSYFIEPSPSRIGWNNRYRYASHGLRFDLINSNDNDESFLQRINANIQLDDQDKVASDSDRWLIGPTFRDRGSLHSDYILNRPAAQLATCNKIAVYPVIGWWRERHHLNKYNNSTRYALIVTITTPEQDIDIYTPVAIKTGIMTQIRI